MFGKLVILSAKLVSKSAIMLVMIIILLTTNFLTLTSSAVHDKLYGILDSLHITKNFDNTPTKRSQKLINQNKTLKSKNLKLTKKSKKLAATTTQLRTDKKALVNRNQSRIRKVKTVSTRIAKRTARNVGVNVSSVSAEAVPWLGIAMMVGVTAMDIKDGCDTMKDMNLLLNEFELDTDPNVSTVCGYELPSSKELIDSMKDKVKVSRENYREFEDKLGGTIDTAKDNIKKKYGGFQDAVGGTLYEILN